MSRVTFPSRAVRPAAHAEPELLPTLLSSNQSEALLRSSSHTPLLQSEALPHRAHRQVLPEGGSGGHLRCSRPRAFGTLRTAPHAVAFQSPSTGTGSQPKPSCHEIIPLLMPARHTDAGSFLLQPSILFASVLRPLRNPLRKMASTLPIDFTDHGQMCHGPSFEKNCSRQHHSLSAS